MNVTDRHLASTKRCVFLLLKSFSPMDLSNAIAVLDAVNQHSERNLFDWVVYSETGTTMRASNGLVIEPTGALLPISSFDTVFICGGNGFEGKSSPALLGWV